jgi:hypothetical protein
MFYDYMDSYNVQIYVIFAQEFCVTQQWLRQVAEYLEEPVVGDFVSEECFENIELEIVRSVSPC